MNISYSMKQLDTLIKHFIFILTSTSNSMLEVEVRSRMLEILLTGMCAGSLQQLSL